jgi:hypothetical protein
MSYVSPNYPLPPNTADRLSECERVLACQIVNGVEQAAAQGQARVQQMPPPAAFADIGLPVAKQAQVAQARIAKANNPGLTAGTGAPASASRKSYAPLRVKIIPLNVTEAEYSGCCIRGVEALAPVIQQQPRISIPPAPIVRQTPQGPLYLQPPASAPPYMPPVSAPVVVPQPQVMTIGSPALPQQSQLPVGRFMGYAYPAASAPVAGPVLQTRGMGAAWGNAGSRPCGPTWPQKAGGMSGKGWLMLLGLGIGAYALTR